MVCVCVLNLPLLYGFILFGAGQYGKVGHCYYYFIVAHNEFGSVTCTRTDLGYHSPVQVQRKEDGRGVVLLP